MMNGFERVWILWVWTMVMLWACSGEEYMRYKDPKQPVNVRVKDLVGRMTLEEKIGQMVQIDRIAATPDIMKNYYIAILKLVEVALASLVNEKMGNVRNRALDLPQLCSSVYKLISHMVKYRGSLLSGGGSTPSPRATATDWVNMVNDFQKGSLSTRLGIPMIYGIDAVHGHNNVYNATIFPHNIGLGATRDPGLVKKIGDATATEVRATGIPYVFAPCIAVCRDPRWGRCYESYSEDPKVVQDMTDIILGLQGEIPNGSRKGVPYVAGKNKVAACAKHFVGDGGTTKGINEYNTVTDMHGLLSLHMPAYYDSIIKGVSTVMVSYSSWNGIKMHANHDLVTGFLKGKLKFEGFVISDWQGIDRITSPPHSNYTYSVLAGVHAGIDMFMLPFNFTEFINDLTYLVKNNFISMDRIDDAVERILLVKFKLGLFENPLADLSLVNEVGSQAHRNLAREAVRKSLVLLKNGKTANETLLPLPKKASRILIAGSHADNLGYQCGGWTIAWQGFRGNNGTSGTTILGAVNSAVNKDTQVIYLENPNSEYLKSNHFDYAIVVVGEYPYTETVGDSENLTMADPGPDVIKNVCSVLKCVVILISGRPIVIEPYISIIDALVAAWLPGTEGQGVTDVLFGDYAFTGKLPRTWFRTVDQLPMNLGDLHYDPLFPFGFGLTTKMVVARSVSAGVDRRPYEAIIMIFVFFGLYFQGKVLALELVTMTSSRFLRVVFFILCHFYLDLDLMWNFVPSRLIVLKSLLDSLILRLRFTSRAILPSKLSPCSLLII
ncbi:glycosyl hydrolase family protein [Striga asiatica]|uniref:Glycosyl hydrolase family protein n=1 Tax=Striga asiatica TaxID=4170 RepID=A0A5A7QEJ6_STRAF|nr:glycosyl hydrolase family protein [Striga asiatica]